MVSEKDLVEIIDTLNLEPELDVSSGGNINGNYIQWPRLESLDKDTLEYLKSFIDKTINYDENDKDEVINALKESGIPDGTMMEEFDGSMPEKYKYFKNDQDQ